jgi:hypothetical protein
MSIASVAQLLQSNPNLQLLSTNRIKCNLTNHEMPPDAKAIVTYLEGQKYKKALQWYSQDYSKYEPYIIQHKDDYNKLFCTITRTVLSKIPEKVEKHFNGKKFQRYLFLMLHT